MRKLLFICLALVIASCGSSRVITSKKEHKDYGKEQESTQESSTVEVQEDAQVQEQEEQPEVDETAAHTTDKVAIYVHKYRKIAQYEMKKSGIPASITLAQGILESGAGNGDLTKRANNHFGIKCHGWKGEKVYHDDDKKGECFRKYDHPSESFKDHSTFLTSRQRYAFLFKLKKTDYKGWARGLKKAGYATDPKYPAKLISLIERYKLHTYDSINELADAEGHGIDLSNQNDNSSVKHVVQEGDTLYSLSRKYNISVEELMNKNNLKDAALSIGQQLIIQ